MLKSLRYLCKGQVLNSNNFFFTSRRLLCGTTLVSKNVNQLAGKTEIDFPEVTYLQLKKERLLQNALLGGLERSGYTSLTPVQQKTVLPMLYEEKGLVCRAKTGTGKTLAFILPTLEYILRNGKLSDSKTYALVIAPTRDLAMQIEMEYSNFISRMPPSFRKNLKVELSIGGHRQKRLKFGIPKIVIATPGRLNDNLDNQEYAQRFSDLAYRVYDEADRILDGGFADTLREIDIKLKKCRKFPKQAFRSVLFSATTDERVGDFARMAFGPYYKFIDCVDKNEPEAHENIEQSLVITDDISSSFNGALEYVASRLHDENFKGIVFLPTVKLTNWFYDVLLHSANSKSRRFSKKHIYRLHGQLTQFARDKAMLEFRKLNHGVLVCTDIAARGINFPDVTCVVQMTPSVNIADYIHKIGRTGRAGARGESVLFSSTSEQRYVEELRKQRKVEFVKKDVYETFNGKNSLIQGSHFSQKDVEEVITSYLSYYAQVIPNYRINSTEILKEVVRFYRQILGNEYAKLPVKRYLLGPAFQFSRDIKKDVKFQ